MKKFFAFALVLAALLSLCSCHGNRGETVDFVVPDGLDPNKTYELTFWAKSDNNATQTGIYRQAIADFEALYPNIKIKLVVYADYGRIYQDVITNIPTGTTPNVTVTYPDHIATYLEGNNIVAPLDELASDPRYGLGGSELKFDGPTKDEIIPQYYSECHIGERLYALPFMRSTEACYVNKTYVEALGYTLPQTLTWDFIREVSEAAMAKEADGETFKINGQKVMIPFIYKSTDNMMIQMLAQLDAPYSTASGEIKIFNDTTAELLYEINEDAQKKLFSTFKISSYPGNYINRGQCIFAVDSTAGASWMGSNAPLIDVPKDELVDFEMAVMTVPQFDPGNPKMISQGPSVCVFNKEESDVVLASWLFAQFLTTNSVQIPYAQTEGYVPVTTKAQTAPEYLDYLSRAGEDDELYYDIKIAASKLLIENTENTFVTPVFNGSTFLRNAAGQMIEEVTKAARRNIVVDGEYITDLYVRMQKLYKLDDISSSQNSGAPRELGELPLVSKLLIGTIVVTDLTLLGIVIVKKLKKAKN
ncbi:MAG: ABC transporter substrate-binding protein [Eubacteriales bacterium]